MRHLLLVGLVAALVPLAACDDQPTTETRAYDVAGTVTTVAVNSYGGRIAVTVGSGDAVRVTETVRYTGTRPEPEHRLTGSDLTFTSGCQGHGGSCGVDYQIQVPATVKATLDSGGGDITVRLPQERYAVDVDTAGGGRTVGVTVDAASTHRIDADSGGGDVVVDYS